MYSTPPIAARLTSLVLALGLGTSVFFGATGSATAAMTLPDVPAVAHAFESLADAHLGSAASAWVGLRLPQTQRDDVRSSRALASVGAPVVALIAYVPPRFDLQLNAPGPAPRAGAYAPAAATNSRVRLDVRRLAPRIAPLPATANLAITAQPDDTAAADPSASIPSGAYAPTEPHFFDPQSGDGRDGGGTVSEPLRFGGLTLTSNLRVEHFGGQNGTAATATPSFQGLTNANSRVQWDKLGGGVTFPVPVFGKHVSLNVNADVEHLYRHDTSAQPYLPLSGQPAAQSLPDASSATTEATSSGAPVLYFPNYVDVVHSSVGAGASLPVSHDVTFSASYNTQNYTGAYGVTPGQSVTERKDQVQGAFTYTIPKTQSSLSVQFRNQQYHDPTVPSYNFNANRGDLNFTVRF